MFKVEQKEMTVKRKMTTNNRHTDNPAANNNDQ